MTPHSADVVLSLAGELTLYTLSEQSQLIRQVMNADCLLIDLSAVTEIDGAGLQLLVAAKRQRLDDGRPLQLTGHSHRFWRLLEMSGLTGFFGDPQLITAAEAV